MRRAAVELRTFENELTSAKISRHWNDGWICDSRPDRGHGNLTLSNYGPAASSDASAERQHARKGGGGRSLCELVHLAGVIRL
jgi:hypothetical protein